MSLTKAPGPDGAHTLFFQKYWNIIRDSITNFCLKVLNGGEEMGPINKTLITLIPKTLSPKKMEEFRLISLCNVVYKIIAKGIANRLKKILMRKLLTANVQTKL